MEETGPDRLMALAYGNHPKSSTLKPEAVKVLRTLREGQKTIEALTTALGIDLGSAARRKHFYVLMRPLRDAGMISVRRIKGKRYYHLSFDGFNQYWKDVKKEAEYWLMPPVA
jgi:DNA-binding transcriptional ArsR family regulator